MPGRVWVCLAHSRQSHGDLALLETKNGPVSHDKNAHPCTHHCTHSFHAAHRRYNTAQVLVALFQRRAISPVSLFAARIAFTGHCRLFSRDAPPPDASGGPGGPFCDARFDFPRPFFPAVFPRFGLFLPIEVPANPIQVSHTVSHTGIRIIRKHTKKTNDKFINMFLYLITNEFSLV